jgi:hypothetical protein
MTGFHDCPSRSVSDVMARPGAGRGAREQRLAGELQVVPPRKAHHGIVRRLRPSGRTSCSPVTARRGSGFALGTRDVCCANIRAGRGSRSLQLEACGPGPLPRRALAARPLALGVSRAVGRRSESGERTPVPHPRAARRARLSAVSPARARHSGAYTRRSSRENVFDADEGDTSRVRPARPRAPRPARTPATPATPRLRSAGRRAG